MLKELFPTWLYPLSEQVGFLDGCLGIKPKAGQLHQYATPRLKGSSGKNRKRGKAVAHTFSSYHNVSETASGITYPMFTRF